MQTNVKTANSHFQPISLEILIETPEELDVLIDMFCYDITIPEMVCDNNSEKREILQNMMSQIHKSLRQYL